MLTKELATTERIQPRFIEPMYAEAVRELPEGGAWIYEAKLDGYRCLAVKRTGGLTLWSRRGNLFTTRFPDIARACERMNKSAEPGRDADHARQGRKAQAAACRHWR